jgi:hypothetical protein
VTNLTPENSFFFFFGVSDLLLGNDVREYGIENSHSRHSISDKFALKAFNRDSIFPLKFLDSTSCNSHVASIQPEHIATLMFVLSSNLISVVFTFTTYVMMKNV